MTREARNGAIRCLNNSTLERLFPVKSKNRVSHLVIQCDVSRSTAFGRRILHVLSILIELGAICSEPKTKISGIKRQQSQKLTRSFTLKMPKNILRRISMREHPRKKAKGRAVFRFNTHDTFTHANMYGKEL